MDRRYVAHAVRNSNIGIKWRLYRIEEDRKVPLGYDMWLDSLLEGRGLSLKEISIAREWEEG